jgi:multidrug efflux pump subunit AcrA (membrane-fusion protein)
MCAEKWPQVTAAAAGAALLTIAMAAAQSYDKGASVRRSNEPAMFTVVEQDIEDYKTVFAMVRSKDRIDARVRIGGTVAELKTDEGRHVEAGEVLALVADQKIALKIAALDARPDCRGTLAHGNGKGRT